MPLFAPNDDMTSEKIIFEFKSIEGVEEQLKFVLLHLYALNKKQQELFHSNIIEYEKMLSNTKFMRSIRYRDSMVKEQAFEYYGNDFGEDDPFLYNEELEKEITKISMKLLATIGLVTKMLKEKNIVIDDEA